MVIETVNALAALDYPNFEVIILETTPAMKVYGSRRSALSGLGTALSVFHTTASRGLRRARSISRCPSRIRESQMRRPLSNDAVRTSARGSVTDSAI